MADREVMQLVWRRFHGWNLVIFIIRQLLKKTFHLHVVMCVIPWFPLGSLYRWFSASVIFRFWIYAWPSGEMRDPWTVEWFLPSLELEPFLLLKTLLTTPQWPWTWIDCAFSPKSDCLPNIYISVLREKVCKLPLNHRIISVGLRCLFSCSEIPLG